VSAVLADRKILAWSLFWTAAVGAFVCAMAELEMGQKFFVLAAIGAGAVVLRVNRFTLSTVLLVTLGVALSLPYLVEGLVAIVLWSIGGFAP
jgi:hypothetical protein